MSRFQVTARTRALHGVVRSEFATEALAEQWAARIFKAKETGSPVTVGNVRIAGSEIVTVEVGPVGGAARLLGVQPQAALAQTADE